MDPLGFALENFDAIGRWRTTATAARRSTRPATLPDGTTFDGPRGLRALLVGAPRASSSRTVTEKLLTYALGRGLESYDMPAVRRIVRDAARSDYRWSSLILGIVKSAPFQMQESRDVMIITKKALAAADVPARAWARRWRCRCSTAWCRRFGAARAARAARSRRFGVVYVPNGMIMNELDAGRPRAPASSSRRS